MSSGSTANGPLERFLTIFGMVFDSVKTDIERLLDNYDVENVQAELIPYIDALIGWPTNFDLPESKRRIETLNAVPLYRRKGRADALEAFVENIADWNVTTYEGWKVVMFTNDPACTTPDLTSLDAGLIGTAGDPLKYTPTQENWHCVNGLLLELSEVSGISGDLVSLTLRKIERVSPGLAASWANISVIVSSEPDEEFIPVPLEDDRSPEPVLAPLEEDLSVWGAGVLLMVTGEADRITNDPLVRLPSTAIGYTGPAPPAPYTVP